jgi:hemerythrin superfamily protein
MPVQLEDNKRTAIAGKLAEMKAFQNLIIANEEILIQACSDRELSNRLEDFIRDDRKNLGIIDTVIVQYGVKAEPSPKVQKEIETVGEMMQDPELTLFEKVTKQELLKHNQAMSGILVHKAAQVVGADIEVAIAPLNTVNVENRAHQEQLKGMMESLSTLELTGQPADQGLWARVQDTMAALSGIAGSVVSRSDNEVSIRDVIRMDHLKVKTLFGQIKDTEDPQKLEEYFGQIYQDLSTHSEAEEQVLYPAMRPYYNNIQKLYDEQAEMKKMLDQIKAMNPANTVEFKSAVVRVREAANAHMDEEERDLFSYIKDSFGDEQQKQLATEFKTAKSKLQDKRLASTSSK